MVSYANALGGFIILKFTIIAFILLFIVLLIIFHIRIDIKSFFRRSFRAKRGLYGTYVFCGEQGKGKTMALATYVFNNKKKIDIYSNVYFKDCPKFTYFEDFSYIYEIIQKIDSKEIDNKKQQVVIIWDELFSLLNKSAKLNKEIKSYLSQLRKRKIIFLTTCQSWPDIPLEFRRLCRFEIDCMIIPLLWNSIQINIYKDAERMKWSDIEQEHVAPIVWTRVYQTNKVIANSYDTNQTIKASNF